MLHDNATPLLFALPIELVPMPPFPPPDTLVLPGPPKRYNRTVVLPRVFPELLRDYSLQLMRLQSKAPALLLLFLTLRDGRRGSPNPISAFSVVPALGRPGASTRGVTLNTSSGVGFKYCA